MEISRVSVRVSSAGVLLLILYSAAVADAAALTTDGLSLLALKSAVSDDPTGALHSWIDTDSNPCRWRGVACSSGGRVASISLSNLSLSGYLPSELSLLSELHTLSLPRNLFSGPLPVAVSDLRSLSSLDLSFNNLSGAIPATLADLNKTLAILDLSHNAFSGSIPTVLGAMESLSRLDLSSNRLSGTLPPSIATLPALSGVLNLSCNLLSGEIPPEFGSIPVAVSLDLRLNNLSGEIPPVGSLLNQGPTAFAGNPGLCGFPLRKPCFLPRQDPSAPQPNPSTDPSTPTPRPINAEPPKRRTISAVPILAAVVIAAVVSVLVLQWQFRKRRTADGKTGSRKGSSSSTAAVAEEWREGRSGEVYVPLDEEFALELEDLLRASAYVVGKSRSGIVYKVVVARGSAVAVRRLSEAEDGDGEDEWRRRRAFESEAATIGRVRHPNVVALRAYYYASDEKLLIYDYIPNGTLHGALHGAAAPPPLPWTARLAILQGAARGLACIHECSPRKYVHGSIRTAKILLDEELRPYVSGFGLTRLAAGARFSHSASKKSGSSAHLVDVRNAAAVGYVAPEVRAAGGGGAVTQRSDVYAFGVVMLEVLTGREAEGDVEGFVRGAFREERPLSEVVDPALLGEVHAKKEVLAVFHVALGCTEADPEARPRMRAVSESLERVGTQS